MSYVIRRTNGDTLSIVNDREVVANYSTKLIGRDTLSYGEILNNNFIHLLENNANVKTQAPNTPILGQSWFQYNANKRGRLSVCMDEEAQEFRTLQYINFISNANGGKQLVDRLTPGELFYDSDSGQLKVVLDSSTDNVIGPIVSSSVYKKIVKSTLTGIKTTEYTYSFDGFDTETVSGETVTLNGTDYVVGDLVRYGNIQMRVTAVDGLGGITGLQLITTSGHESYNTTHGILIGVETQNHHEYPEVENVPAAAVVKISSTNSGTTIREFSDVLDLKFNEIVTPGMTSGVYYVEIIILAKASNEGFVLTEGIPTFVHKYTGTVNYTANSGPGGQSGEGLVTNPNTFTLTSIEDGSNWEDYTFRVESSMFEDTSGSANQSSSSIPVRVYGYMQENGAVVEQQIEWRMVATITAC